MKLLQYQLILWLALVGYSVTSYLILLRDAFLLERLSLTLEMPQLESNGIRLASTLNVNLITPVLLGIIILAAFWGFIGVFKYASNSHINWSYLGLLTLTVFMAFPALSRDIFDYNNANRVAFLHQQNPWIYPAKTFPDDSEIYYGSWITRASVYPPVSFLLSTGVYYLFGYEVIPALIGFKLLAVGLFLTIGYLLWKHLPSNKQKYAYLFWFNPLILIEFIGNGHNDLALSLFVVLGFIVMLNKQIFLSGIFFILGILAKFSIGLYVPIIWLKQVRKQPVTAFGWLVGILAGIALGFMLMGESGTYLLANLSDQFSVYLHSIPSFLRLLLMGFLGQERQEAAEVIQKVITLTIFLGISGYYLLKRKLTLADQMSVVMMLYLWIQAPMLQPWYIAWYLPLISLVKNNRIRVAGIVFCLSSLLSYPAFFVSLYLQPLSMWWQLLIALVMVLPPAVSLYAPDKWYTFLSNNYQKL